MITHFQWSERKNNWLRKEWKFSFFFKGNYFNGIYFKDGTIEWAGNTPPSNDLKNIEAQVHDLVLYHIFEDHTPPT
ncbi:DUF5342 family protein [Alteribacillus sp. JSM 102045]|uniref:DUF5342 family protein n=1 Tax=Alteribacillus sp. JSM 102045 TaxID=1562101 RepID=UPI0035BFF981